MAVQASPLRRTQRMAFVHSRPSKPIDKNYNFNYHLQALLKHAVQKKKHFVGLVRAYELKKKDR